MSGLAVCTLFTQSHLPRARVLERSLRRYHPDIDLFMLFTDIPAPIAGAEAPPHTELLSPSQIMDEAEFAGMRALYQALELSTALKPYLMAHLLRLGFDRIVYFDSDVYVVNPLDPLFAELDGAAIALTPHLLDPVLAPGTEPSELNILMSGTYNMGFLGISRSEAAETFLAWWQNRLRRHAFADKPAGMMADQRWVDLVPGLFEGVKVLRHPGCNVAYWNMRRRGIEQDGARWRANGKDLLFFHFSGFDPATPSILSKWENGALPPCPAVEPLALEYAEALKAQDFDGASHTAYGFDHFSNGVPFTPLCRHLLRAHPELLEQFWDPLQAAGESFYGWLRQPVWRASDGSVFSRYVQLLHQNVPDLRARFPDPLGADLEAWKQWLRSDPQRVPEAFLQ